MDVDEPRLGRLRLFTARPECPRGGLGVLLYPTIFGLDDTMRGFAHEVAATGRTAVVWDPYDGEEATGTVPEVIARSAHCRDEEVVDDLGRVVDHMLGELELSTVAGLGWCFGGRIALLHAGRDPRVGAVCSYNPTIWPRERAEGDGRLTRSDFPGQTMDEPTVAAAIEGPVQVSRPEHDFTGEAEYASLAAALRSRAHPTFSEYHPGAEHGFSYTPGPANERAHRHAWAATLTLLATTFDGDDSAESLRTEGSIT